MVFLTKLKPEPMGAHSLSVAYGVNSLVMSEDGAAAYISVKDVPAGTPLSNTDYWQPHTDLSAVAQKVNAARDEMLEIALDLTDTAEKSGNPVQAELVGRLPFDRVATSLEPIQAGSGDPSPTNIRAISGWTSTKLTRCGKNLCPGIEGGAYTNEGGMQIEAADYKRTKKIPITDGTIYSYSSDDGSMPNDVHFWDKDGNWITVYSDGIARINNRPEGAAYMAFNYYQKGLSWAQVEIGSACTAYEPYTGDTYAADFGQTVYGGTLNWQTGVLTVDRAMVTLDGTEAYGEFGAGYPNLFVLWAGKIQHKGVQLPHEQNICSHYKSHASRFDENNWYLDGDGLQAFFNDLRFNDVNGFVAYVAAQYAAGTPVQISYMLATPTTIQLTPREIRQLRGVNTLCGDGSISIVGRVNPAIALDARIAALEAAALAE